jgi:hypothetical protein
MKKIVVLSTGLAIAAVAAPLVVCMKAERAPDYAMEPESKMAITASPAPASPPAAAEYAPSQAAAADSIAGMSRGAGGAALARKSPARPRRTKGAPGDARDEGGADEPTSGAPAAAPKRMVHYNGFLKLKVTNPTQTLQQASEIADGAGGYVESLTSTTVTLRVPVASFRRIYDKLTTIGDVLSRSMTAQDVTDQFVAMDLRVKTLRASRDRLIALLGKAQKAREKLDLLREIQRLTEEIDQLEMYLTTLASLAELSRITVEAVPHQVQLSGGAEEPIAVFRWIHALSPFRRDLAREGDRLELKVPTGMVELSDDDPWVCEAADGAVIWAHRRDNDPQGSSAYWIEALRIRLAPEYGSAEVSDVGPFKLLRLVDQSEKAYRYLVAVRARGDDLEVVEVYYPTDEHEKRYGDAVRAVISGGAS